jgi:hypothetical protein
VPRCHFLVVENHTSGFFGDSLLFSFFCSLAAFALSLPSVDDCVFVLFFVVSSSSSSDSLPDSSFFLPFFPLLVVICFLFDFAFY